MKKFYLFTLMMITLFAADTAFAEFNFGFSGSFNLTKLSGDFRSAEEDFPVYNFAGGIGSVLIYHITPQLGIQVEPMFMERGGQNGDSGDDWTKIHLTYIDLPIFLRYQYKIPYFLIGYYKSYLLTAHLLQGREDRRSIDHLINDENSGINLGVGFDVNAGKSSKFMFELNYFRGFSNLKMVEDYQGQDLKQHGLHAKVGILFKLGADSD